MTSTGDLAGAEADVRPGPTLGRATIPAGAAFVLGGAFVAYGAGLRWYAPGYGREQRLTDDMSPLLPTAPALTVPGSIAATAIGYLVLALAWIVLMGTPLRSARRWSLVVGAVCASVTCAALGGYTAVAGITGEGLLAGTVGLSGLWTPFTGLYALGGSWVLTSAALLSRRTPSRWVATAALAFTAILIEVSVLYPFSADAWDDPAGLGVLSGVAYTVFGGALAWDHLTARASRR